MSPSSPASTVFIAPTRRVDVANPYKLVDLCARRRLAPPTRTRQLGGGESGSPSRPARPGRRRRVRPLGRQTAAQRGRIGVCRPRRPLSCDLGLGRGAHPGEPVDGQHMAGRVSDRQHKRGRPRRHCTGLLYPPNGYGLYDMIGNVWEWTADWYQPRAQTSHGCCSVQNPHGGHREDSFDPALRGIQIPRRVMKGGSDLCAPNYCRRYRPAARMP